MFVVEVLDVVVVVVTVVVGGGGGGGGGAAALLVAAVPVLNAVAVMIVAMVDVVLVCFVFFLSVPLLLVSVVIVELQTADRKGNYQQTMATYLILIGLLINSYSQLNYNSKNNSNRSGR